jgi:uncharacterized protein (DUF1015 family)
MRINPFRAIRPRPELAAAVASVPYDVVNRAEAAALAEGNPHSFLHVGRSDIDLPADTDPHDPRIYAAARAALDRLLAEGTLVRDRAPALFLYRLTMDGRAQTGVVGCVHVDDYEHDLIRKHEKTRKDKEDDRTRHVLTLNAHAEPVFLTYRTVPAVDRLVAAAMGGPTLYDFTAPDGVWHTVWRIADVKPWIEAFGSIPLAYVADGHHRSASAWRAGQERRAANRSHTGAEEYNWFLAVLFPRDQLKILPYNRLVRDLNGLTPAAFRERLASLGRIEPVADPIPPAPGVFNLYFDGHWERLTIDAQRINHDDPIRSLDVSLLQELILAPILGITDPRTDRRVDFVGGIRGTAELERRVKSGEMALAISLFPTTVDQLLAVADAGAIMPPKSTWFEPKLRSGLFVHELDQP